MKPPAHPKPNVPIAIHCRCGNQIVLEPRWIGKPAACAQCEAHFIVSMVTDVRTGQRMPHVRYTPPPQPQSEEPRPAETAPTMTCRCGARVPLDERVRSRDLKCPQCGQSVIIRPPPLPHRQIDAAGRPGRATPRTMQRPGAPKSPSAAPAHAASASNHLPPPPDQMTLICTCGETLAVPLRFYDRNMYCAACGTLMHLRLIFEPQRNMYELITRILDGQPREKSQ